MQFDLDQEQEEFRQGLCEFLHREIPTGPGAEALRDLREQDGWDAGFTKQLRRRLGEAGYIGMAWPAEYGGGGRDMTYQVLFAQEMEYLPQIKAAA